MAKYFTNFPIINYANNNAINIMDRVSMLQSTLDSKQSYYTYVMQDGQRPENLAYDYYNNPHYMWLVCFSNQNIDPYYDFPISSDNFNAFIVSKYGSVANAQNTIIYFQNNYLDDDSNLNPSGYAALPPSLMKYWNPQLGSQNQIVGYQRKPAQWTMNTNQVVQCTLASNAQFTVGELVTQAATPIATVVSSSGTTLILQHMAGSIVAGNITGLSSNTVGNVLSSNIIAQPIPANEAAYWSPVTAYDYEMAVNEDNKNIVLLDNKYAGQAYTELKNLLNTST
jgi:hypothetical protein